MAIKKTVEKGLNKSLKEEIQKKKIVVKSTPIAHGVGRRKSSVARVWLRNGNGEITINNKPFVVYFHTEISQRAVMSPLLETQATKEFNISVNVHGGGVHSQADAARLGISRALAEYKTDFHAILRAGTFLTVDSRVKERKKYGQRGARRKFQFVKR